MASVSFLSPVAQFSGKDRLLNHIRASLGERKFSEFRLAVAYAKSRPLAKLSPDLQKWTNAGKTARAIIGLNQRGTSRQALEVALGLFNEVYVCFPGSAATFHPKLYLFSGATAATCFFGSHNLTVGGLETNYEAGIRVDLDLPTDSRELSDALKCWDTLLPASCVSTRRLDAMLLEKLITADLLLDESVPKARSTDTPAAKKAMVAGAKLFPTVFPAPPLPMSPADKVQVLRGSLQTRTPRKAAPTISSITLPGAVEASAASFGKELVIQIAPHHNGEIFLSKLALNQNPGFFGFPFTGRTTPKRAGNASYPQRVPDPVVDVTVFDSTGALVLARPQFELNTVFYERKTDIRVTVSPDILRVIEQFSILHMRSGDQKCDYYFNVYNPGSARYNALLAVCNQRLPSGGGTRARRMGWL